MSAQAWTDRCRKLAGMETLVVLPTYNEAENIEVVLAKVRGALPAASILVVDDGSPDGTADLAERTGKELGNVDVLRRTGKSGLGSAYRAGFRWGLERGFDACVEMDSDLSHDPAALPSLVAYCTVTVWLTAKLRSTTTPMLPAVSEAV